MIERAVLAGVLLAACAPTFLACASRDAAPAAPDAPLVAIGRAELPGVDGRIDHLAWDAAGRRLFVAALGNGSVEVVQWSDSKLPAGVPTPDLGAGLLVTSGHVVARLSKLDEPQGIAWLAETHELAFTTGGDGMLHVVDVSGEGDATKLAKKKAFAVGSDADNVRLDAAAGLLWIGCEEGLAIVDVKTWTKVGAVRLAGHAESFQLEPDGARIFVNVPDARHVAVVDRAQRKVVATWPLDGAAGAKGVAGAAGNYPMALDAASGRLYVGCREPARLLVLDVASGARQAALPIGTDTDDLFVDPTRRRVHVACGGGEVTSFALAADGALAPLPAVATGAGARTALLVPDRAALFVAFPHHGGQSAAVVELRTR